jgi:hypothetical protein
MNAKLMWQLMAAKHLTGRKVWTATHWMTPEWRVLEVEGGIFAWPAERGDRRYVSTDWRMHPRVS